MWQLKKGGVSGIQDFIAAYGTKYRQLHIEDYLQEIPAEQGKVTGEYAHEWITESTGTNADFWTDNLLDTILRSDNLNAA